jgi:uncharacterized protein with PIN domain
VTEIRFYTDEQVHKAIVRGLRQRGIDVLSVPEAGTDHADDDFQLKYSTSNNRVLFTQDQDFLAIAVSGIEHSGIVYGSQKLTIGQTILGLVDVHREFDAESMTNAVKYLKR